MATELTVKLPNRTGQLASVAGALGDAGVNIRSLAATTGAGAITVVMSDSTVGRPVELNGTLHIPGAMPLLYDGVNATEVRRAWVESAPAA